jgi:hypothetical protein
MPRSAVASTPATSPSSSFSLPSLPSSSPTLDDTLERITTAKAAIKEWESTLQQALTDLDSLVDAGEVNPDEPLTWNDFKLTSATRKSYTYPEHIQQQQAALKQAQELAVALGEAEAKLTTYWTIRSL